MNWSLVFSPLVPMPVVIGFAILAAALVLPGLVRRMRGALLRAFAALALVAALANPVLLNEEREPLSTVVAIVVDKSASQSLDGRDRATDEAAAALASRLGEFRGIEVRTVEAGGSSGGTPVDGTALFGPLATALADVPPERVGAVIMLTDGQVHDIPADRAGLPNAPLHVLLSGHDGEVDRRIVIDAAPRFGIVNEKQTVRFRVIDDGRAPGGGVRVAITRDGEPLTSETVTAGVPSELTVDITHGGQTIVEFEAEPLAGELTPVNNRAAVVIEGIRENLRVLLISGEPHSGERTWRNLLKSDASVDLVHFTILRPPEKQDGTPINQLSLIAFPTRELFSEKIDQFDLIIFDRYQHRGVLPLLYFDNIARYVRAGGALLVAAGPDYADAGSLYDTPLAPVLPAAPTGKIINEPYYARLAKLGERHPVTRGLEGSSFDPPHWGRFFRLIDVDRPDGDVVMEGAEGKPLLVLNRQEKGRVALLLSDHMWLWARGYEGGGPHVDLLRRLAHWLMKEPDLEEERLIASAKGFKLTVERRSMEEGVPPVQVSAPGGDSSEVTLEKAGPGLWRSTVDVKVPGLYKLQTPAPAGTLHAVANAGIEDAREMSEVTATDEKLKPLVEATGGGIFWTRGGGLLSSVSSSGVELPRISILANARVLAGSGWLGLKDREAFVTRGVKLIPMFTGFMALAALLALLAATWWREGR